MSPTREQLKLSTLTEMVEEAIKVARRRGASDETKVVFVTHGLHPAGRLIGYYYNNLEDSLEIIMED